MHVGWSWFLYLEEAAMGGGLSDAQASAYGLRNSDSELPRLDGKTFRHVVGRWWCDGRYDHNLPGLYNWDLPAQSGGEA